MDAFEELESKNKEAKRKEEYKKFIKRTLLILNLTFGGVGFLFLILGIVFIITFNFPVYLPFVLVGGVFLLVILIINIVFKCINYDKLYDNYKKKAQSGRMIYSTHELITRVLMLENKVRDLEEEVERLKNNR